MRYFVVSDVHSYFTIMKEALAKAGYDESNPDHCLVILGDLFDRGPEAKELAQYLLRMPSNKLKMVRGNHEDLFMDMIYRGYAWPHDKSNGTKDTLFQLTDAKRVTPGTCQRAYEYIRPLLNRMEDFIDIGDYLLVHGWFPPTAPDYHAAPADMWHEARWYNGMEMAANGYIIPDKTVVCGHWHTSWGHAHIQHVGSEWGEDADFSIYRDTGIIALDACTAYTKKINCLVIEGE